ncbi:MAG: DUF3971 domain-containing protein [Pseudomonadota bacterium]
MKSALLKLTIIAIEGAGVVAAALAGGASYLLWLLESGPVSLDALRPIAVDALDRRLPDERRIALGSLTLIKDKADGAYNVVVRDLSLTDEGGRVVFNLERSIFNITASDLFGARMRPRRIVVETASVDIIRSADRRLKVDIERDAAAGPRPSVGEVLQDNAFFFDVFERAELVDANFTFRDEASGRQWTADQARASLVRVGDGFEAEAHAQFDTGEGAPARLDISARLPRAQGDVAVDVALVDAPVSDLIDVYFAGAGARMTGLVTGEASVLVDQRGRIRASRIDGRARDGVLTFGGFDEPFAAARLAAAFDPDTDRFDIVEARLDGARIAGAVNGEARLYYEGDGPPARVEIDLQCAELALGDGLGFQAPLRVADISLAAAADLAARRYALTDLKATAGGAKFSGSGSITLPDPSAGARTSPAAAAALSLDRSLNVDELLTLWPLGLGAGARDFVRDRMAAGTVSNVRARLDLDEGALDAGGLPDEALAVTFDIAGADVDYAPGMSPLTGARGVARLGGDSFRIDDMKGAIGPVSVDRGSMHITAFRPRGADAFYRFEARGGADDVLAIIDQKPLELLKSTVFSPEMFAGDVAVRMEIMRPNMREVPREDYRFNGQATFGDLTIADLFGGARLEAVDGAVAFDTDGMTVSADAALAGSPIAVRWRQDFRGSDAGSLLTLSGVFDSAAGDVFGVGTRQFLRGAVSVKAEARGALRGVERLDVTADFLEASLAFEPAGWRKPAGVPVVGVLGVDIDDDGIVIRNVTIEGDGVDVRGAAGFDPGGALRSAHLKRFHLDGSADVAVGVDRTPAGAYDVTLTGPYLNLGPMLSYALDAAQSGAPADEDSGSRDARSAMLASVRLDVLELREGVVYRDASLDFRSGAHGVERLDVSARGEGDGALVSVALSRTGAEKGPSQTVEARTDDLGALLRGLFGLRSVEGGQGVIDLIVRRRPAGADADSQNLGASAFDGVQGTAEAGGFRVVGAPLLARIFAAGSAPGMNDLLAGEGIEIAQSFADFGFRDGVLHLRDVRAAGPSVGISAAGRVAGRKTGGVDLSGSVAPVYGVNAFLGRAPLIGDLFVSRDGEGLVALSYQVRGAPSALNAAVNPLSALAPGAFRRLFEVERGTIDEMMDADPPAGDPSSDDPSSEDAGTQAQAERR